MGAGRREAAARRWLLAAALGSGVATTAYRKRALTESGAMTAAAVGTIVFSQGGLPASGALLTFFSTSSVLSHRGATRKAPGSLAQAKGARRDAWQVLANGAVATLSIWFGRRRGRSAFLGAVAAAAADTWATELGMRAGRRPRLITTWQPVAPGMSGGVTPEGLAASLAGAASVGLAWWLLRGGWRGLPVALAAGTCGSLVDSWLGASLQALYECPACGEFSEEPRHPGCGRPADLVSGCAWMTNDTVNALATLAGAGVGGLWRGS